MVVTSVVCTIMTILTLPVGDCAEAATKAHAIFSNSVWANAQNCAFIAKHGLEGDTYTKVSKEGNLLVPARDIEGRIHNLQIISNDGAVFLRGGRRNPRRCTASSTVGAPSRSSLT